MRIKGIILLVIGLALLGISFPLGGGHDVNAILSGLAIGVGGSMVVASLAFLLGKPSPTY